MDTINLATTILIWFGVTAYFLVSSMPNHQWWKHVTTKQQPTFTQQFRRAVNAIAIDGAAGLGELYDLTANRLIRYARTIVADAQHAEDAVQAAMVRVATKPKLLVRAEFPWAYLMRIARNEAIRLRGTQRTSDLLDELVADWPSQANGWAAPDIREHVRAAIARLPESQSQVVILKIWEDMTFAEIATVLEISNNTAASRYRYAIEKLTMLLQHVALDEEERRIQVGHTNLVTRFL